MKGTLATLIASVICCAAAAPVIPASAAGTVVPDLSGTWAHPSLPGFEPPASGPGPVRNKVRTSDGVSDWNMLVGDYSNPILRPEAAEAVRKYGDVSIAGRNPPTPANQCWPQPLPFIFSSFRMQMLQKADKVTLLYSNPDREFRQVRINGTHPAVVVPSWYGDSVGHYEGDTLVIDTIGIKVNRPYAMVDAYGTPYSDSLRVVERYRLLDYEDAKEGLDRDAKENVRLGARDYRGKHLQLEFTVYDEKTFTMPWTATITYAAPPFDTTELVCAENIREFGAERQLPRDDAPDF